MASAVERCWSLAWENVQRDEGYLIASKQVDVTSLKAWPTTFQIQAFAMSPQSALGGNHGPKRRISAGLKAYLKAIHNLLPVFDVFIQQQPFLAAVLWGSCRFLVKEAVCLEQSSDKVWFALQPIIVNLVSLSCNISLFEPQQTVLDSITAYFAQIIVFLVKIREHFGRPKVQRWLKASFTNELDETLESLERCANQVAEELRITAPEGAKSSVVQEILNTSITMNDEVEGKQNPRTENPSYNPEAIQTGPHTDSGYASARHDKFEHRQNALVEDYTQSIEDVRSRYLTDEGNATITNNTSEGAQNLKDLESDEIRTIYSDASSVPTLKRESYISELADDLFSKACSENPDSQTIERISGILPELLKAFALKVGHNASTQMHRDVMFFVHKHRSDIVRHFETRYFYEESLHDVPTSDTNGMSLEDKMMLWAKHRDDIPLDPDIHESDEASDQDSNEETNMPKLFAYRDFVFKAPAYEWLLASLRREFLLAPAEQNSMEAIRRKIICSLPSSHKVSRKKPAETYKMTFWIEWDPLAFVKEQEYREEPDEAVEMAITLTGSAKDAQALTCAQYLCQTWPSAGEYTIRLVKDVVRSGPGHRHISDLPDGTKLIAWTHKSKFMVEAFGTGVSVAEVGEQLAWLGAALRSSPYELGVASCTPFIIDLHVYNTLHPVSGTLNMPDILCKIDFTVQESEERFEPSNGQCWHNLFRNPVIVKGYPIPRRFEPDTGLEISLNMMAALAQARRATNFGGRLFLKGFCTMLIPTRHVGDLVIWHMLFNKDGSHISYVDPRIGNISGAQPESISVFDLETPRHVLGWCSNAKNYTGGGLRADIKKHHFTDLWCYTGAPDANYTIDWSSLKKPHKGCVFENVSISGGKFITAGVTAAIGKKDKAVHIKSRDDYVTQLKWIAKKFVVLYDVEDRRAWLVDGASALLHLVRASLKHDQTDDFKPLFLLKSEDIEEPATKHTGKAAAIHVLTKDTNQTLKLYSKPDDLWDEKTTKKGGGQDEISKKKMTYFRFNDRVEQIYHILEQILAHQAQVDAEDGIGFRMKYTPRRQLEGFDFMDVATDEDPFWSRVTTLRSTGKGWVDFIKAIHAITLFGRGFGELIKPADTNQLCPSWVEVPKGKDCLAVCVSDIKEILKKRGSVKTNPWRLVDDIYWHQPDKIFEACQCAGKTLERHCDRVQVLLPASFPNLWGRGFNSPGQLEDHGAVIFGHSWKFPLRWGDRDDPKEEPPSLSEECDAPFDDSGIGSSLASPTVDGYESLAASISQQPSSEGFSSEPLPGPAVSGRTTSNNLQAAAPQSHGNCGSAITTQRSLRKRAIRPLLQLFRMQRKLREHASE